MLDKVRAGKDSGYVLLMLRMACCVGFAIFCDSYRSMVNLINLIYMGRFVAVFL